MLFVCLSVLGSSSCLVRRRVISRQGATTRQALLTSDKDALIGRIESIYNSVHDFSATVDMTPALGSVEKNRITEYKDVRGYVLFRKPEEIRIIGLYPVVRNKAFDMVSNGTDFRLYVPVKNRFIIGRNELTTPSANKIENLRPQHFIDAMLIRPPAGSEQPVLENLTDEDNATYVLELIAQGPGGMRLSRSVWFDRYRLMPFRELIFDDQGNILTDARYSDWQTWDNVSFPKHIQIDRPRDEYSVVLTVVKMDINKGLSDDKFVLEQPPGSTLQVIGQKQPATVPPTAGPAAPQTKRTK
jgi:outer membrane lipoprotein-sorting protein